MNKVRIGEHDYLQYGDGAPIRPVKNDRVEVVLQMNDGEVHFCSFSNQEIHKALKQVMKEVG